MFSSVAHYDIDTCLPSMASCGHMWPGMALSGIVVPYLASYGLVVFHCHGHSTKHCFV